MMFMMSSSFPWWLTFLYSQTSSILLASSLVTFGYVVPALSSVKAVVHRDPEAYTQWVSYWLILHLLNLIDSATPAWWLWSDRPVEPSWLRVPLLLWLSLPRYRGASVLYGAAIAPFLHDDDVERRVDGKLGEVWSAFTRWAWTFASTVARQVMVTTLTAGWSGRRSNLDWLTMAMMAWRGHSGRGGTDEERRGDFDDEVDDDDEEEERRLSPHHSLRGSSSTSLVANFDSSRTSEDEGYGEDDGYAEDFANLLSRGLYVFALEGSDGDGGVAGGGTFRLRILSYRSGDEGERGSGDCGHDRGVLVLSRVDRRGGGGGGGRRGRNDDEDGDRVVVPLRDVDALEPSGSRNVSLNLVSSSSVVELMLSDGDDRDTLLTGLRSLRRRGCRRRSVDDVSGVVDDGGDDAEEDASSSASSHVVPN